MIFSKRASILALCTLFNAQSSNSFSSSPLAFRSASHSAPRTCHTTSKIPKMALALAPSDEILSDPELWSYAPIIDWDKFYSQDPDGKVPKVYSLPQRYGVGGETNAQVMTFSSPRYDSITTYFVTDDDRVEPGQLDELGVKVADISGDLFEKILGPHPNSSVVPEPFRNILMWMEDNPAAEELCSFNRWAWRSQSEEGNGRVIGVGAYEYDWTKDAKSTGALMATKVPLRLTMQQSPCKKYYMIYGSTDLSKAGIWLGMNIIQEGEVLVDTNGKVVPDVKPGDVLRVTYGDGTDPYDRSPANITFMYRARKVAEYDEKAGAVKRVSPAFEELMVKVKTPPPAGLESAEYLTVQERFELKNSMVSDSQLYMTASPPPFGDAIENL